MAPAGFKESLSPLFACCLFTFPGSVCQRGGGVSPLVSFVSVLLVHLHAAPARPVFAGSRPHLRLSLPAAAPDVALVPPQRLRLPRPDGRPRCSVLAPPGRGRGRRRHGCFDREVSPRRCGRPRL